LEWNDEILLWLWREAQNHMLNISAGLMAAGFFITGWHSLGMGLRWQQSLSNRVGSSFKLDWQAGDASNEWKPRIRALRVVGRHLSSVMTLSSKTEPMAVGFFCLLSILLGLAVAWQLSARPIGGQGVLPSGTDSLWIPLIGGIFSSILPCLIIHAMLQSKRVKRSYELLPYTEELERQLLATGSPRSALEKLVLVEDGSLRQVTYRLIHAIQRGNEPYFAETLAIFEHQVGTKFAHVLMVLIREAVGVGQPYGKDIRVGLRSLIEKMHLQQQIQDADHPKKREISQIGMLAFPALFGFYELAKQMLSDKTSYYMFETPSQMNLFIASVLLGCLAFTCNIIFGRRKLDL
jgi:hypothetical protein